MRGGTKLCKLPNQRPGAYKWPKLTELHQHLFGEPMTDAHNALADTLATARCYVEMQRLGAFT